MTDRVLNMLGIARKAGKICSGEFQAEDAVRRGKACLVIIAGDAAKNSRKNMTDACAYYKVPAEFYGTKESLGRAIGCEFRAVVCVTDQGIADKIVNLIHVGGIPNVENQGQ
ncbi:MAG: ribosomal L7Ae/L30e/S12e/Gadd45 family protein [Lachnospiraceae bacterium]|nr:ribosomal L7Ae/L30e/S12e/Gadd45 family protein [Lachnospiraceae bacterium]